MADRHVGELLCGLDVVDGPVEYLFERLDERILIGDLFAVADVEQSPRMPTRRRIWVVVAGPLGVGSAGGWRHQGLDNMVGVGEVPERLADAEHADGLALEGSALRTFRRRCPDGTMGRRR